MLILNYFSWDVHWLKNSASSLLRSGCLLISRMGLSSSDICTGPREPLGGNLISGSATFTLLLRTTGICIGAIGTLAMIA